MTLLGMDDEKLKIFNTELDKKHKQLELIVTNHKWRAYLDAVMHNRVSGNIYTCLLDIIDYDCKGIGISANYGYIAQERGFHLVSGKVEWTGVVPGYYTTFFYVNGAMVFQNITQGIGVGISYLSAPIIRILPLDVGDEVIMKLRQTTGVNTPDVWGGANPKAKTHMEVHLLSRRCF